MKPVSLVLGFGLIAILGVACQPPTAFQAAVAPPPAGAPPTRAVPSICQAKGITSASDFVNQRAFFLSAAYNPRPGATPTPGPNIDGQSPYSADLAAAFDAAPPSLQAMLCDRDYEVFIVQNSCPPSGCSVDDVIDNSWGFRQRTLPPKRYIATSAVLWQNGSLPTFGVYENRRLQAALQRLDANARNWPSPPPQFQMASPDTTAMSLLAVLAHEAGHVLWYDAFVSPPGGSFAASNFCGGNFYPPAPSAGSWSNVNVPNVAGKPPRWIDFGDRIPSEIYNPDHAGSLKAELFRGDFGRAGDALFRAIQDPGLAGMLAAYSPDEDFVEAYELYVLTNASPPLTDLTIQVPGHAGYNIPGGVPGPGKGRLRTKMGCLTQYIQSQSWPLP